jgi:5-(carboxyamino)imidazole ribonucleotide synthase
MFAAAAGRLGYPVAVWDPDPDAPAHRLARHSFPRPFTDGQTLGEFSRLVSAVTYEWENVPASLCSQLEQSIPVRPAGRILRIIQDRIEQKTYLKAQGFPVADFVAVTSPREWDEALKTIGYPAVCKTATAGYDGKGQWRIAGPADIPEVRRAVSETLSQGVRWVLESFVPFERELSVLVVRGCDGGMRVYPTADNEHEEGILRMTVVPADIFPPCGEHAGLLARQAVERLEGVGVFCVELFQLSDATMVINEIAPRPHNSGHYTLDACTVSQFEQQVRALCGLPLGETRLLSPVAMVNLIGDEAGTVMGQEGSRRLLSVPGAVLHLYGKRTVRPRRKMGHVAFIDAEAALARAKAMELRSFLAKTATR